MPFEFVEEPIPKKKKFEFVEEEEPVEEKKRFELEAPVEKEEFELEKASPMAQAYLAQVQAFTPEGRKGIKRGAKSQISGATFGLSELVPGMKPEASKDEHDQILQAANRFVGSMLPWGAFERYVVGPIGEKVAWQTAKSTMSVMKPLLTKLATKMAVRGVAAPAINTLENLVRTGEVPSKKELITHGAWVAGLGGLFDSVAEIGIPMHKALGNIAKSEGRPIWDVYKQFGKALKNKGYSFFKGEGKPVTPRAVKETGIEFSEKGGYPTEEIKAIEVAKPPAPRFEFEAPKEVPKVAKPPVPPEKPPLPPTKPSGEEPAVPQKITESTAKYFSKLGAKFDVEYPFKKIDAPETGFAVKNYYDRINFHIEKGKQEIKKIKKLDLTKDQLSDVVLAAEKDVIPKDPKIKEGREILRKYFDDSLKDLKKEGILKKGYHERLLDDLNAKIKANDEIRKISKPKEKAKLIKENNELRKQANEVAKLRFVSIPVRELFETHTMGNPALTKRVISYLTKKKRKTLTMEDLVDSGAIKKEDLTPEKIVSSYSKKYGRDMALAKIINAGKKEGLVSSKEVTGMVKIPGYIVPELAKYYVSPTFADFVQGYTNPKSFSNWEKWANRMKGWSFYNPAVLGFNNLWQHLWAVLGQPQHLLKLPSAWKQAVLDVKNKTPNYWEAFENGIRSSPFVSLEKNIEALTTSLKKEGPNPLLSIVQRTAKYPKIIHEKLYDAMQTIAWTGGDMIPRMATYNWLRSIGLNSRDAAQTAAKFHGDYASVPADIRRKLNKFVYTPTFPIVMGKTILENLKNSGKVAKISYERAKREKRERVDPKTKARASGLIGATIILGGAHMTMKSLGFDTVFPLWHYKRDYRDKEGKLKTQHVYLSLPLNTVWKYVGRGYEAFMEPGIENRLLKFAKRMKFQAAIPIQILWELLENKNRHWKEIYDPRAPVYEQAMDMLTYIGKRALPFIGIPLGERFRDPKQQQELVNEFGRLITLVPSIFTFKSDTDRMRARKKAASLKRKMQWLKRKKRLTPKEKENYMKEIKRLKEVK
jgi:hypothetical protein